ncbi:MAG: response regulator [Desulfobulbaceae bacterium]|nr:response regulator [Desulfobulbaceae bacterium]
MKVILTVDDNANDRELLRCNFEWYGDRTIGAANGLEGLEMARTCKTLDLIISDAEMPDMDGFQFLQAVKHDPQLRDIPFIFYSAVYVSQQDEELALRMGARAFISKPKGREEFWKEVCKALIGSPPTLPRQTLDNEDFISEYSRIVKLKQEDDEKTFKDQPHSVVSKWG